MNASSFEEAPPCWFVLLTSSTAHSRERPLHEPRGDWKIACRTVSKLASSRRKTVLALVAVPQQKAPVLARASEILAQLGEELAFVEAGKDTGLLPVNSLGM